MEILGELVELLLAEMHHAISFVPVILFEGLVLFLPKPLEPPREIVLLTQLAEKGHPLVSAFFHEVEVRVEVTEVSL